LGAVNFKVSKNAKKAKNIFSKFRRGTKITHNFMQISNPLEAAKKLTQKI
jgi:hypothetical protein